MFCRYKCKLYSHVVIKSGCWQWTMNFSRGCFLQYKTSESCGRFIHLPTRFSVAIRRLSIYFNLECSVISFIVEVNINSTSVEFSEF